MHENVHEVIELLRSYKTIVDKLFMCDAYIYINKDGELDFEVSGGTNTPALDFYERLELVRQMKYIETLFNTLTSNERKVIFHFYIAKHKQTIKSLCEELKITHTSVYRIKKRTISKLIRLIKCEKNV